MYPVPVLMYHSVAARASSRFQAFTVSPTLFAEHMACLRQKNRTPITVTRFVQSMDQGGADLPDRPVVLTFDDGFADFHTHALPVLARYGFTATLYVTSGYIGQTSRWLTHEGEADRPMLSWDQLGEAVESGIECGGHGHRHLALDTAPEQAVHDDVTTCKRLLEERLAGTVSTFAYPFGYYTPATQRLIRSAGYTSACAVRYAFSSMQDDRFALARLPVGPDMSADRLAGLLDGAVAGPGIALKRYRSSLWRRLRRIASTFAPQQGAFPRRGNSPGRGEASPSRLARHRFDGDASPLRRNTPAQHAPQTAHDLVLGPGETP